MVQHGSTWFRCPVCRGSGSESGSESNLAVCAACWGDGYLLADVGPLPASLQATRIAENLLRAAVEVANAACGTIQFYDSSHRCLRLVAYHGFGREFLDFFQVVSGEDCACGTAMAKKTRIVVPDVSTHPIFKGQPSREIVLRSGIRSVQSTPILGASGQFLGALATHQRQKRRPSARELAAIDSVIRQFVPTIEASAPVKPAISR